MEKDIYTEEKYIAAMFSGMQKAFRDAGAEEAIIPDRKAFEKSMETGNPLFESPAKLAMFEGVRVIARWWGVQIIFPEKDLNDLKSSTSLVAAITGILAAFPATAPIAAVLAVIFAAHLAIWSLVDRGNGIMLSNSWPTILSVVFWIPTPLS